MTNLALQHLSISERTMVNSISIFFVMGIATAWGLERWCRRRLLSALLLVAGSVFMSKGEGIARESNGRVIGQLLQCGAILLNAVKGCTQQHVMQRASPALAELSHLELVSLIQPVSAFVSLSLAIALEPMALEPRSLLQPALVSHIVTIGVALCVMLTCELQLVDSLSAVAFNVLGSLHGIPTIVAGVILCGEHVGLTAAGGFAINACGAIVYVRARAQEREQLKKTFPLKAPLLPEGNAERIVEATSP